MEQISPSSEYVLQDVVPRPGGASSFFGAVLVFRESSNPSARAHRIDAVIPVVIHERDPSTGQHLLMDVPTLDPEKGAFVWTARVPMRRSHRITQGARIISDLDLHERFCGFFCGDACSERAVVSGSDIIHLVSGKHGVLQGPFPTKKTACSHACPTRRAYVSLYRTGVCDGSAFVSKPASTIYAMALVVDSATNETSMKLCGGSSPMADICAFLREQGVSLVVCYGHGWKYLSRTAGFSVCDVRELVERYSRVKVSPKKNVAKDCLGTLCDALEIQHPRFLPRNCYEFTLALAANEIQRVSDSLKAECEALAQIDSKTLVSEITYKVATVTNVPWSAVLSGHTSKLSDLMMVKRFIDNNVLPPNKYKGTAKFHPKGGTVLPPTIIGCNDWQNTVVGMLDYASLYLSVTVRHGICLTPNKRILPTLMASMIEHRATESAAGNFLAALAYKLVGNVTYGTLAFTSSRFYCPAVAHEITRKGQEALAVACKAIDEDPDLKTLYAHTDGVMVELPLAKYPTEQDVIRKLQETADKIRDGPLYMKVDGVYDRVLLCAANRYAVQEQKSRAIIYKGLEPTTSMWPECTSSLVKWAVETVLFSKELPPSEANIDDINAELSRGTMHRVCDAEYDLGHDLGAYCTGGDLDGKYSVLRHMHHSIVQYKGRKVLEQVSVAKRQACFNGGIELDCVRYIPHCVLEDERDEDREFLEHPSSELLDFCRDRFVIDAEKYSESYLLEPVRKLWKVVVQSPSLSGGHKEDSLLLEDNGCAYKAKYMISRKRERGI